MANVLTLIADPLEVDHVEAARRALDGAREVAWLARGKAAEFLFEGGIPAAEKAARHALEGSPVDLLAQAAEGRRRRLLIADMDSTIITVECIDEMADMLGLRARIALITEQAMRGEIDFPAALRERAAMLAGLGLDDLERVYGERVRLTAGARALVRTMRTHGAFTALVSGGFSFFTGRVAAAAGFHDHQANELVIEDGRMTGKVSEPIIDSGAKLAALTRFAADHGLGMADTMAVGDGANDLPMIEAAGLGVAFHAQPIVEEKARARVAFNDLRALLYFQGYRDQEIVPD